MTEDYKEQLLNYITDSLNETSPDDEELFADITNVSRSKWIDYIPSYWQNFRYEGMVEVNEATSSLTVLYGGFIDSNGIAKGIITLVNDNFEPIKTFYKFLNGTDLRYIQYMKQAEDGTFYYIDDTEFSYIHGKEAMTSQKRFVMINNITVKNQNINDYVLSFRTSYIIPDEYKNFYCHNMFKDPSSSHYIFFGGSVDPGSSKYDYRKMSIFSLKINVGMANEWTSYVNQQNSSLFGSAYAMFSGENVSFRCVYTPVTISDHTIKCVSKGYTGSVSTSTIHTFNFKPYIDEGFQKKQSVFLNMDEVYYVQNNSYWGVPGTATPKYIGLYKYDFTNGENKTIFEKYLGDYDFTYQEYIMIDRCNTDIYIEYVNNYDKAQSIATYHVQRYNGTWDPILIATQTPFVFDRRSFFAKANYNLLQLYSYAINPQNHHWFYNIIKEDYNVLNYNSGMYVNSDILAPIKGRLYSGDRLLFARNLYNITKQNNTSMASMEVPNTYLNDETIDTNNLYSKTNLLMNSDNTQWTKNIYEVVDLNFLNTISVIDEDTGNNYLESAIKVNNSITDGGDTNYQNTPCNKYRINYTDNTTEIHDIQWIKINNNNKETNISFYVEKDITSIDLISNDETTIYLTIPLNVTIGKYYNLKQKIRIGDKPTPIQLQYNNEDILYNNEPVMVYAKE